MSALKALAAVAPTVSPAAAKGAASADATGFAAILGGASDVASRPVVSDVTSGATTGAASADAKGLAAIPADAGVVASPLAIADVVAFPPVAPAADDVAAVDVPVAQRDPISVEEKAVATTTASQASMRLPLADLPKAVGATKTKDSGPDDAAPARKRSARDDRSDDTATAFAAVQTPVVAVGVTAKAPAPAETIVAAPAMPAAAAPAASPAPVEASAPHVDLADAAPVMAALGALPGLVRAAPVPDAVAPAAVAAPDSVATTSIATPVVAGTADLLAARTMAVAPVKIADPTPPKPDAIAVAVAAPIAQITTKADVPVAKTAKRGERKAEAAPAADLPAGTAADTAPVAVAAAEQPGRASVDTQAQPVAAGTQLAAASTDRHVAVAKHAAWADGIARDIASAGATTGTARFTVSPETLGTVQVSVKRNEGGGADVTLTASSAAAQSALTDAKPQLIAEAKAQGLHIREALVDVSSNGSGNPSENRHSHAAQPVAVPEQPVRANAPSTISLTDTGYGGGVGGDAGRQAQQQAQGQQAPQATVRTPQARAQTAETPTRERADDGRYA